MSDVYLGSLMLVPYQFAPKGYAFCAGQLMSISQNTALFSLLGTTYGGDGKSTFALPNLQGRVALGFGQGPGLSLYDLGEVAGTPTVTLLTNEVPQHNHTLKAEKGLGQQAPANNALGEPTTAIYSASTTPQAQMAQQAISVKGGSLPHNNLMPFQTLNWIIALQGVYPPRT